MEDWSDGVREVPYLGAHSRVSMVQDSLNAQDPCLSSVYETENFWYLGMLRLPLRNLMKILVPIIWSNDLSTAFQTLSPGTLNSGVVTHKGSGSHGTRPQKSQVWQSVFRTISFDRAICDRWWHILSSFYNRLWNFTVFGLPWLPLKLHAPNFQYKHFLPTLILNSFSA